MFRLAYEVGSVPFDEASDASESLVEAGRAEVGAVERVAFAGSRRRRTA